MSDKAEQALDQEFGCYYLADEIDWLAPEFAARIEQMAADSARNIVSKSGRACAAPVAELLRSMMADRRHPMFEQLCIATMIMWSDDDEWPVFVKLATAIADNLDLERAAEATTH